MIASKMYKGEIYAGDTPLHSTIRVEQVGPWTLRINPGEFRTTGQSELIDIPSNVEDWIASGHGELFNGRLRKWLFDEEGRMLKAKTYTLDQTWDVTLQPIDVPYLVRVDLCDVLGKVQPFARYETQVRQDVDDGFTPLPEGINIIHPLVFPFAVEPTSTELPIVYVLTVKPGFPSGWIPGLPFQFGKIDP